MGMDSWMDRRTHKWMDIKLVISTLWWFIKIWFIQVLERPFTRWMSDPNMDQYFTHFNIYKKTQFKWVHKRDVTRGSFYRFSCFTIGGWGYGLPCYSYKWAKSSPKIQSDSFNFRIIAEHLNTYQVNLSNAILNKKPFTDVSFCPLIATILL